MKDFRNSRKNLNFQWRYKNSLIEIQFHKEVEDFFRSAQQLTDPTDKEAVLSYLRDNGIGGRYCNSKFSH